MEQPVRAAPRRSAILLAALVKLPVAALIFFVGLAAGTALTMAAVNRVNRMSQARMAKMMARLAAQRRPHGMQLPWLPEIAGLSPAARSWALHPVQAGAAPPVTLAQLKGRPVFLDLWATWCAPCVAELPAIQALSRQPSAAGTSFVLLSTESESTVREFLRRKAISLPFYIATAPAPPEFSEGVYPATFIIDRDGRIVVRHLGTAKWDDPSVANFLHGLKDMK